MQRPRLYLKMWWLCIWKSATYQTGARFYSHGTFVLHRQKVAERARTVQRAHRQTLIKSNRQHSSCRLAHKLKPRSTSSKSTMHRDLWTDDTRFTLGHHTLQSTFNQVTSDGEKGIRISTLGWDYAYGRGFCERTIMQNGLIDGWWGWISIHSSHNGFGIFTVQLKQDFPVLSLQYVVFFKIVHR